MRIEFDKIAEQLGCIDLFVCSSGFESRSTSLAMQLNTDQIDSAWVFHLHNTYAISTTNLEVIRNAIPKIQTVEYPKNEPLKTYDLLRDLFEGYRSKVTNSRKSTIVIDVTTFTREVLLILIRLLSEHSCLQSHEILLVYMPADSYPMSNSTPWLSSGVREIRSIFGYAGQHSPEKPLLLMLLSGFEQERAEAIVEAFEPNKLVLARPTKSSSITPQIAEISSERYLYLKLKYKSILIDHFEFSCSDVVATRDIVTEFLKKYAHSSNIVISPLNNKISTIGVALAALQNDVVQVCYASANQYNIFDYSRPSDYFLTMKLNDIV